VTGFLPIGRHRVFQYALIVRSTYGRYPCCTWRWNCDRPRTGFGTTRARVADTRW